jgi:hypothetical protein
MGLVLHGPLNDGVSFVNVGDGDEESNNEDEVALNNNGKSNTSQIACSGCNKKGHYAVDCKEEMPIEERQTGAAMLMVRGENGEFDGNNNIEFMFLQPGRPAKGRSVPDYRSALLKPARPAKGRSVPSVDYRSVLLNQPSAHVPKNWILLDNQSTVDVFYNNKLLRNVPMSASHMDIHCNAGVTSTDMVGDLPGYGEVWYHPNGIANILSLGRVKEKHRLTFDSADGNQFVVHKNDGTTKSFKESRRGLYFMNTATTATALVNTVEDNKSRYTNRNYSRAVLARKLQNFISKPST